MTQTFYPLANSPILTQEQWSKMAQNLLNTGVIKGMLNELQVYADSTGMQVKVKSGQAWIKGHFYESDAEEVLAIGTANSSNPRIDRVILRVDWIANSIQLAVLQGVPAVFPVAPSLTQNSSRWEIVLAQVLVGAGVATIAVGSVSDERNLVKNANSQQEKWIALALKNGWSYVGYGATPAFRISSTGSVYVKGLVGTGTAGQPMATLPIGFRPLDQKIFTTVSGNNAPVRIDVLPNGDITVVAGSNVGFISLDMPPFLAEQ